MPSKGIETEAATLKDRGQKLIAAESYKQLREECTAIIQAGSDVAYLAYLFRAAAWWMSGARVGPDLLSDVQKGLDLAGADPDRRADALYMALGAFVHVGSRYIVEQKARELQALAREHPPAARYLPGVFQLLALEAMSREAWPEALRQLEQAQAVVGNSPRAHLEARANEVNLATVLLTLGQYDLAHEKLRLVQESGVQFGCMQFQVECLLAIVDALRGDVPKLPAPGELTHMAKVYWLLSCSVAERLGHRTPEVAPADQLRSHIQSMNAYAFSGLAAWGENL